MMQLYMYLNIGWHLKPSFYGNLIDFLFVVLDKFFFILCVYTNMYST